MNQIIRKMEGCSQSERGFNMQLSSGSPFFVTDPRPDEIQLHDIAHALSNICRFGGHTLRFYSVADHSVMVSNLVPPEMALAGLLHDAAEAYVGDIIKPIKYSYPDISDIEKKVWSAIAEKFALPVDLPKEIKDADMIALAVEKRDVMGISKGVDWGHLPEPPDDLFAPICNPQTSKKRFLDRWFEITMSQKNA